MSDGAAIIYIDGASRGNPGDAAYAIVIEAPGRSAIEDAGARRLALAPATPLLQRISLRRQRYGPQWQVVVGSAAPTDVEQADAMGPASS